MAVSSTSLQLSGLASGFDWKNFVNQIMAVENAPINRLNAEKARSLDKVSSLTTLSGNLTSLQTSAKALSADGLFGGRLASSATASSSWTPSAATDTATGTYRLAVSQLAKASRRDGAVDISSGLNTTNDVSGVTIATMRTAVAVTAGTFTVNGQQVTVATTDSLQTVFANIAAATSGHGDVTASYSAATDKVTLGGTGEIVLGAANDTSNFLQVMKLANNLGASITSSATLGTFKTTAALASAGLRTAVTAIDGSGNGTFSLNGVAIAYNMTTDTLTTLVKRINDSTAGVTAAYDSATDKMALTNNSTGDLGVTVTDSAGGLAGALGLVAGSTLVHGQNALFTVNGGATLTSTSNTLDAAAHGITGLSVTVNTEDTQSIAVTSDIGSMRTAINRFIQDFNSVQSFVDQQTAITKDPTTKKVITSVLTDNREIQDWSESLRRTAFAEVSGLSGTIKRLENLGIDFKSGSSTLKISDSAKLDAALANKPADVKEFFSAASTGFSAKFGTFLDNVLGTSGSLATQQSTLTKGSASIDNQIAAIQRRLDQQRELLTNSFIAMESAQSRLQQQGAQITKMFSSSSNN